jgi:hypothetical protein
VIIRIHPVAPSVQDGKPQGGSATGEPSSKPTPTALVPEQRARYQLLWIAEHVLGRSDIDAGTTEGLMELLNRHLDDPEEGLVEYLRAKGPTPAPDTSVGPGYHHFERGEGQ